MALTKEQIEELIARNREEINSLLHKNLPIKFIHMRINDLAADNKYYIEKLKELK